MLGNGKKKRTGGVVTHFLSLTHTDRHTHTVAQVPLSCSEVSLSAIHPSAPIDPPAEIYDCLFTFKPQQQPAERCIDFAWLCVSVCVCVCVCVCVGGCRVVRGGGKVRILLCAGL